MSNLPHTYKLGPPFNGIFCIAIAENPTERIFTRNGHVGLVQFWINVSTTIGIRNVKHEFSAAERSAFVVFQNGIIPPIHKRNTLQRHRASAGCNEWKVARSGT